MRIISTMLLAVFALSSLTCAGTQSFQDGLSGKTKGLAIGCTAGLLIGALVDEKANKDAQKSKKNDPRVAVTELFKKRKAQNKGKVIGLAAGCLTGLGVGHYLDTMASDMEERLKKDGIIMEKVKDANGETNEIYLNMGEKAVEFEANASNYKSSGAKDVIKRLAENFAAYPETKIKITGHISSDKVTAVGTKLSQQRADAVKSELVNQGVPSSQIVESVGKGSEMPLPGSKPVDPKNRRVDFRILGSS